VKRREPANRLCAALLFFLCACKPFAASVSDDTVGQRIAKIEGARNRTAQGLDALPLEQVMHRLHVPGMSIAVINNFGIEWARAYGVADVKSERLVKVDTRFQAASISKAVTAMAALRMVQQGEMSLDSDVNTLLKSWKVPKSEFTREQPVTPRSLFSHTSGAADGFGFPGYPPNAKLPSVVQILEGRPPANTGPVLFARPPYRAYQYSGGGIMIMQLLMTDQLGEPFDAIMQRLVVSPLGMSNSSFEQPPSEKDIDKLAYAHDEDGKRMEAPWHIFPEQAAAGLWTTASDLARFVIEIQRAVRGPAGEVLTQATAREMVAPVGVGPNSVGLRLMNKGDGWYFYHGGNNTGFDALVVGHLRKGYGVVIMTNAQGSGYKLIEEVQARVAATYHWDGFEQ